MASISKRLLGLTKNLGITTVKESDKRVANSHFRKGKSNMDVYGFNFSKMRWGRAMNNVESNFLKKAIKCFYEAIILNPNLIEAYYYRAYCNYRNLGYSSAVKDLNKVIEMEPDNVDAYILRGWATYKKKVFSIDIAKSSDSKKNKNDAKALDMALFDFDEAIFIDPNNWEGYWQRVLLYPNYCKYNYEILRDLNSTIEFNPTYGQAYYDRAEFSQKCKIVEASINSIAKDYYEAYRCGNKFAEFRLEENYSETIYWDYLPEDVKETAREVNEMSRIRGKR